MKATLPSVSTTMEEGGFSLDEATIERIIDYFDMSADGEVDKGQFFIPLLPCSLFHPFNHFAAILKESSTTLIFIFHSFIHFSFVHSIFHSFIQYFIHSIVRDIGRIIDYCNMSAEGEGHWVSDNIGISQNSLLGSGAEGDDVL